MALEIRPVREDETASYVEALSTAFLQRPDVERVAREIWPLWEGSRTWAAVDRRADLRHVPELADRADRPGAGLPPGRRRVGRDGAPDASTARRAPLNGCDGARGDPRARPGVRPAARLGVPDLRTLRLRVGLPRGDLDAGCRADDVPRVAGGVRGAGDTGRRRARRAPQRVRRVACPPGRRDPPTRPLLGLRARAARRVLGREVERLPGHPPRRRRRSGRLRALPRRRSAGSSASHATPCRSTSSTD